MVEGNHMGYLALLPIQRNGVLHILKRHEKNGTADHSMANLDDASRIGYILDNYDTVERTLTQNGEPDFSSGYRSKDNSYAPLLTFSKKINGSYYVIEAVPDSSYQKMWVVSAYIGNKKGDGYASADAEAPGRTSKTSLPSPVSNTTISQQDTGVKPSIRSRDTTDTNAEPRGIMLPTAAEAEETARLRRDATELERSGIAAGVSDEDMQTARRLSNVLGREIRFYDGNNREGTEAVANGYYDRNTIYVNSRSQNPVAQIISHELTHSLESAKAYGELSNMILGELERTGEDLSRMRAEKKNLYARNGVMLSNENANREIVAEYVEKNLLSNETKILELTRKNRTLAQRISGWIQSTLAKLGNKKSQERAFLERAYRLYAKALRQTQNETGQRMPQEAQSTMQNRAQESTAAQLTEVQKYREPSRDAEQTVRRTEEPERYETRNAAPTERVNPEGMRELQEAYAAGQITDEEFDDAIDALMEEEGLLDRDMLDAQYSISYDKDNRPFVIVENDILDGVPESEWVRTVKNNLREKFPDGVRVGNNEIKINNQSRQEMTFSRYMQRLLRKEPELYADKLRATANADEILKASRNWVNEALLHPRNDAMIDFARGEVQMQIGENDYTAQVIVGNRGNGNLLLYDIIDLRPTQIQEKRTGTDDITKSQRGTGNRQPIPVSGDSVAENPLPVNPSIRESVETDTSDQYMQEDGEKYTPQYSMDENERATGYDDRGERWDGTMMEIGKDQTEREAGEYLYTLYEFDKSTKIRYLAYDCKTNRLFASSPETSQVYCLTVKK